MKRVLSLVILSAALVSCGSGNEKNKKKEVSQNVITSPVPAGQAANGLTLNEQNGINQVLGFYGGAVSYSKGLASGSQQYFKIEVSKSGALDSSMQIAELSVANISILLYSSLQEERTRYSEIRTVVNYSSGQKAERTYETDKLDMVLNRMEVVMKIVGLLKEKKYDDIAPLLNDQSNIIAYKKSELINKIKKAEPGLGEINQFIPYGFMFATTDKQKNILHIAGVIQRANQNNEFSVDFDPSSTKNEAIFLNYKL